MTRLTTEDLKQGPGDLKSYDHSLKTMTGKGFLGLALETVDMTTEEFNVKAARISSVSIIPITTGQGLLPGFPEKVAEVGRYLGLTCRVTAAQDVAGLGEAVARGSEIIMCADDDTFLALNLVSGRVVNNANATGQVYAAALTAAARGVAGRCFGVLGLGPVGRAAAVWLRSRGARLVVCDIDQKRQADFLAGSTEMGVANCVGEITDQTNLVLDATNASDIINAGKLRRPFILSAPGIPLGLDDPMSDRVLLIHDPLQLGVAAMLAQVLAR
jgi:pyrrolysine biosynthesis protein PylD